MNLEKAKTLLGKLEHTFIGKAAHVVWISIRRYREGEYAQGAVALTYYSLFAIVPVAALFFGIAKGFELDVKLRTILAERLSQHKELLEYVCQFADTTLKHARGGVVAGAGVAILFFAVIGLYSNIERALNAVWELPPRRNLLHRFSNYISCMVVIPMLMVMISSAGVFLRTLAGQSSAAGFVMARIMPLVLASAIFFLIYFLTPNTKVRLLPALVAGVVAGVGYQLLQDVFVFMQRSIFRYNRIYGSFAALPLFMIWLRWSWEVALFGAELGFVMQNVDTGMFDVPAGSGWGSDRGRRFRQLAAAFRIYSKFYAGEGASSFGELSDSLAMPTVLLERDLEVLISTGVVCRVAGRDRKGGSYVPLLPASLTVAGCLRKLDDFGEDEVSPALRESAPALSAAETKLYDAMLASPDDLPLVDVGKAAATA